MLSDKDREKVLALIQKLGDNSFEAGYVANKANKIFTSEDINTPGDFESRFIKGTAALIRPGSSDWRPYSPKAT